MIKSYNLALSKSVILCIIKRMKKDKNLKLYYKKGNKYYASGYLDMIITSNYEVVDKEKNYYKFKVTINNINSANNFELFCCLTDNNRLDFTVGKHIYGLCYYRDDKNTFSTAYGICFDNFAYFNNNEDNNLYFNLNDNIFKVINKENYISFNRIMNTDFYFLNFKE